MDSYDLETPDVVTSSDDYATRFTGEVGAWFLEKQAAITLDMLADYSNASVLDVGGGHGQITTPLLEKGYDLTIIGSTETALNQSIKPLLDGGKIRFDAGNLLDLPYPDGAFDVVISYRLVTHMRQWPRLIEEMARVAKKAVIIDYPERNSINVITPLLFGAKKRMEGNTREYTLFTRKQITETFAQHGLHYAAHKAEFFFPMVLHRKLKRRGLSAFLEFDAHLLHLTQWFGSPVIIKFER